MLSQECCIQRNGEFLPKQSIADTNRFVNNPVNNPMITNSAVFQYTLSLFFCTQIYIQTYE